MPEIKVLNLPTEVQLALEVMPCQANRRVYEPAEQPHPCTYFAEWGVYHSFDYASAGPPPKPGIEQEVTYAGKTALLPEILSGCRKAPIMSVGINPNLPGYWPKTHNAVNPLFGDYLQYAHYFRYRSIAKLQIPRKDYKALINDRPDSPDETDPLTDFGAEIPTELAPLTMYEGYQSLLDGLAEKQGWAGHKLAVGEDLSYANMVACPSAKWVVSSKDPKNPEMPVMGTDRMRGIVGECFHERKYFLRQLFQSLPVVLVVFSQTTAREFIVAMADKFIAGDPKPGESFTELAKREIRLGYGTTSDGAQLSARVIFSPHVSANPQDFAAFRETMIGLLSEEVTAGRLLFNQETGHLARPRGGCVFCTNALYRIGACDYEKELQPLAAADAAAIALASDDPETSGSVALENAEQDRMLKQFLGPQENKTGPTPLGLTRIKPSVDPASVALEPDLLNVDELDSAPFVLKGRIVTMNAANDVIEDGWLFVKDGIITAVAGANDAAPDGFADAPVIETGGTIYPGLLDLHNHLAYNVTQLWNVPRKFNNRAQWQRHVGYAEQVKMPLEVLTRDPETAKAIVRYVEVKALLGGTTVVQGMRSKFSSLPVRSYAGVVRNFERTDDDRLPDASGRIPDLNVKNQTQIDSFRNGLANHACYFYHLSEGLDAKTREQFLNLVQLDLLQPSLVGIHSLALEADDLLKLCTAGGKVVWSPMSNSLLYGATIDANRLVDAKIPFALGCDWSPSGSKNVLEEMKVAWLSAQADGAPLTKEDICVAATRNAAQIVGWGEALGTLEQNKYADLVVIGGNTGDVYEKLLAATERDVQLVTVQGYARFGASGLMDQFAYAPDRLENLTVGGADKKLYLYQKGDPLKKLTFAGAMEKLRDSMGRLRELDTEVTSAAFSLSADDESFQLELDNDDFSGLEGLSPELAAEAEMPESIALDVPTVIDDEGYFERLKLIKHLPDALDGLGDYYK